MPLVVLFQHFSIDESPCWVPGTTEIIDHPCFGGEWECGFESTSGRLLDKRWYVIWWVP